LVSISLDGWEEMNGISILNGGKDFFGVLERVGLGLFI
jgi:hypothetical protein